MLKVLLSKISITMFKSIVLVSFLFTSEFSWAVYCTNIGGGSGCLANDQITSVEILGTSLHNINNSCSSPNNFLFPASGFTTTELVAGATYQISINTTHDNSISVWIDYNQNTTFEATEYTFVCSTSVVNTANFASFTIPATALSGPTRMRVRSRFPFSPNGPTDACTSFSSGETEDYTVTIVSAAPCSGAPVAGNAVTLTQQVCPGATFFLSLQGNQQGAGLSYQWQSSPDDFVWTDIPNDTNFIQSMTQTVGTYYQCVVSCGALSSTSSSVFVATACYCQSAAATIANGVDIGQVNFGTLSNGPGSYGSQNWTLYAYTDYTYLQATNLTQAVTYPISIYAKVNGSTSVNNPAFITVFIDFNKNSVFDFPNEAFPLGPFISLLTPLGWGSVGYITIPETALTGITRMRVVANVNGPSQQNPCGIYTDGETEDYLVNIVSGLPCNGTPVAGIASVNDSTICIPTKSTFILTGNSVGMGQIYQWQSSPDSLNWTDIVGATDHFYVDTILTTTYVRCMLTCSGQSAISSVVKLNFVPVNQCYCTTGSLELNPPIPPYNIDIGYLKMGTYVHSAIDTAARNNAFATQSYTDYTALTPILLSRGVNYAANVVSISSGTILGTNDCLILIDFNQNGSFEVGEYFSLSHTIPIYRPNRYDGNFTIPFNAKLGLTRMRVAFVVIPPNAPACGSYSKGETEDYTVNIDIGNTIENSILEYNGISVFPNPANEMLTISCSGGDTKNALVQLYNLQGQLIFSDQFTGNYLKSIDVKSFSKGLYVLQFRTGEKLVTRKVVIE